MGVQIKPIIILSTLVVVVVSVLIGIFLPPWVGVISGIVFWVGGLIMQNTGAQSELKSTFDTAMTQLRTELLGAIQTIKDELPTEAGLPFVAKYWELYNDSCALFKYAVQRVYKKAMLDLDALANRQIAITNQEDVFHWLEFLFKLPSIKRIKATSYGEFKEWMAVDSLWLREYVGLHRSAQQRGASIERIFIVKGDSEAKGVEGVLQNNRKYNVSVKVAIERRIRPLDLHAKNCLVFCNERDEPLYALIAQHNREGFQNAVIFGAPHQVEEVATMYSHIAQIAEPYIDGGDSRKLTTRIERTSLG